MEADTGRDTNNHDSEVGTITFYISQYQVIYLFRTEFTAGEINDLKLYVPD